MHSLPTDARQRKRARCRGNEIIEFTLIMVPLLATIAILMNVAWAVYTKATLQRAVRMGVRKAVTITAADLPVGKTLADIVRDEVQTQSMGLLNGPALRKTIEIHFYDPSDEDLSVGTDPPDVTASASPASNRNIIQVSINKIPLAPLIAELMPGIYKNNPLVYTVMAADRLEPTSNPPPAGQVPKELP